MSSTETETLEGPPAVTFTVTGEYSNVPTLSPIGKSNEPFNPVFKTCPPPLAMIILEDERPAVGISPAEPMVSVFPARFRFLPNN